MFKKINIAKKVKELVGAIRDFDQDNKIKIVLSTTIDREGFSFKDKTDEENKKLESYYSSFGIRFISNTNFDASCLNRSKFDFNKKAVSALARNICMKYMSILNLTYNNVHNVLRILDG